ncbi:MAG: hypothetical protein RMK90_15955 [Acetobacteraceae bacterium]|nr:hypothetical protein [Acetobacteraceae bacterium]
MADEADRAQAVEALLLAEALARRRPDGPPVTGYCLNCRAPLAPGRRFCDADCRDEWQRRQPRGR